MKRKILLISLVIVLTFSLLTSVVSAASLTASMTANKTTVPEATEFTVTIKVSNIDAGVNGINTVEGILSYDKSVFEALTTSSIDGLTDWEVTYTPDTGKLMLYKMSWANEDQDIAQITLKTKKSTAGKSGEIKYSEIVASNNESEINVSPISTIITVGNVSDSGDTGNTSSDEETNTNTNSNPQQIFANTSNNTNVNTNTNTNANTNTNSNTNRNANGVYSAYVNSNTNSNGVISQEEDIPYTGASDNIMRAIFVVLVIAGVSYFKYESIKEY